MINQILRQAGVDTVEELYNMYPDEASFIAAYPEFATEMKMGGTPEAFPQTATMDKFFSYGVPTPPTYHRDGGQPVYPYIQSEAEFFSPVYADIVNPYNKEYGGMMEAFPQATPYYNPPTGNAYGFMAEGGQPEEMIGVQNRIGNFMNKIADTASNARNKETMKMVKGMAKLGGLPLYQDAGESPKTYNTAKDYFEANPLTPYQKAQMSYDANTGKKIIEDAYRKFYGVGVNDAVYSDDPIYKELGNLYDIQLNNTPSQLNPNQLNLNQLAITRTPRGRGNIKIKATIDGQTGRGRSDDYMWQSMFNTENLGEAQRIAAEQGLKIDEGTAGLFGKRKKYTYTWGNPTNPGKGNTSGQKQESASNSENSNMYQSAMQPMTADEKVQKAYDWSFRPNQPLYTPEAPVIGPEGPIKEKSMLSKDAFNYGGLIKAKDGKVVEKETSGFRQGLENFADNYGGMEQFYKNQGFKSMATNMLNTGQQPDMVGLATKSFEMMNPALGTQKGTQDPQGGNIFYDKTYAVYDSFAPQYMQDGGGMKSGDVVYWDDNMIDAFIQAGGEVEFLD